MAKGIQIEIGFEGEMVTIPLAEYEKLVHYKDTTVGLWCTDRLDLVQDYKGDLKNLMFQLDY